MLLEGQGHLGSLFATLVTTKALILFIFLHGCMMGNRRILFPVLIPHNLT